MIRLQESLTAQFCYVFPEDDAVDKEHEDFDEEAYDESFDLTHLPIRSGEQPTRFYCKPLSRKALTLVIDNKDNVTLAMQVAVAYGLHNVENGPEDFSFKRTGDRDRLPDAMMDKLYKAFGIRVLQRVGNVIVSRSTIGPL